MITAHVSTLCDAAHNAPVGVRVTAPEPSILATPAGWLRAARNEASRRGASRLHVTVPVATLMDPPSADVMRAILAARRVGPLCLEISTGSLAHVNASGVERLWAWTSLGVELGLVTGGDPAARATPARGRECSDRRQGLQDLHGLARLCPEYLCVAGAALGTAAGRQLTALAAAVQTTVVVTDLIPNPRLAANDPLRDASPCAGCRDLGTDGHEAIDLAAFVGVDVQLDPAPLTAAPATLQFHTPRSSLHLRSTRGSSTVRATTSQPGQQVGMLTDQNFQTGSS